MVRGELSAPAQGIAKTSQPDHVDRSHHRRVSVVEGPPAAATGQRACGLQLQRRHDVRQIGLERLMPLEQPGSRKPVLLADLAQRLTGKFAAICEMLTIVNICPAKAKMVPQTADIERPLGCPPTRPRHALDR